MKMPWLRAVVAKVARASMLFMVADIGYQVVLNGDVDELSGLFWGIDGPYVVISSPLIRTHPGMTSKLHQLAQFN